MGRRQIYANKERKQDVRGQGNRRVYPEGLFGATLRGVKGGPRKARLVVDQIRGLPLEDARQVLRVSSKRFGFYLDRLLLSAQANAQAESNVSADELYVIYSFVDEGFTFKRFMAGPMGRARPIIRRTSNVTVVVGTKEHLKLSKKQKVQLERSQAAEERKAARKSAATTGEKKA
ncbi:MAG: 50S ribosomal protein L22 [Planctomycetota bacterium]